MSDPNDPRVPTAPPPAAPEPAPAPASAEPAVAVAMVPAPPAFHPQVPPSGPYRLPEPPEAPMGNPFAPPSKPPRTTMGPALTVFGVLLWSFVVAGQYTTSWMTGAPLNQGVAVLFVLVTTFIAFITSLRQSRISAAPRSFGHLMGRAVGVSALSFLFFILAIFAATVLGSATSRNHDLFIAFLLVALATGAAIGGPRLTSPVRLERTHSMRVALTLTWIAGALLTLVAGIDLASNG
jgi:hypothetical protein